MLIEEQIAERRLRARKEAFKIESQGRGVFGDYQVFSPASKRSYRVALRGVGLFDNYCACPDYAVNTLGDVQTYRGGVVARALALWR